MEDMEDMEDMENKFWKYGQIVRIAKLSNSNPNSIYHILDRVRGVSIKKAKALEIASGLVLVRKIPWQIWIDNKKTIHPAFKKEVL